MSDFTWPTFCCCQRYFERRSGVNISIHAVELHVRYFENSAGALGLVETVCRTVICEIIIRELNICKIIMREINICNTG